MLDIDLIDEGTLDTAVSVHCNKCGRTEVARFSMEFVERDKDGTILINSWKDIEENVRELHICNDA